MRGEYHVVHEGDVVLTTILGSCVAACIRDPYAQTGGMNHFLLPGANGPSSLDAQSYGVHLMELLVNGLLQRGAHRHRLEAKLFGGARTIDGLSDIGAMNGAFAETFLRNEGITIVGGDLGGDRGRRVEYWPLSGRARQFLLSGDKALAAPPPPKLPPVPAGGSVEFF
ncbi:chemotaxis protein CheD [Mesorhizobium sp. ANAO-SY3R2]|uniref:chemotaxis protein CheD n=1 Tax=Mesorhizobium sp. ANAO-SY3R2 TaxID=3166644 RepID=UPI003673099D